LGDLNFLLFNRKYFYITVFWHCWWWWWWRWWRYY